MLPPDAFASDAPLGRRVAANLGVLAVGRGAAVAMQFAAFAVVAAHLGPERLGVYTFAIALVGLLRLVPAFGFDQIVPRDIAQRPEVERVLVPNVVYLRLLLALLAYGLLAALLVSIGYDPMAREAALVAGIALALVAGETMRASLATRLRLGWSALGDSLEAALTLGSALALVAAGAGVLPFLLLYVAAKALNVAVVAAAGSALSSYSWRPHPSIWWPIIAQAAPLAAATLAISVYYRLDLVVLARIAPNDEVGQYGLALKFMDAAVLLTAVVMSVVQPVLARSLVEGRAILQRRYGTALHLMAALAMMVGVGGAMTAWRVVPAVPGLGEYEGGGVALAILAPAIALILVTTVVQGMILAARGERTVLRVALVALAANVVLIAALIPAFSYRGAAVATTVTELVVTILSLRAARTLGVHWPRDRTASLAVPTIVLVAVLLPGFLLPAILQVTFGVAAFVGAAVAAGTVSRAELADVFRRRTRPA